MTAIGDPGPGDWIFPIRSVDLPHDPYTLASWWANRAIWGAAGARSMRAELSELAIVCGLELWTLGWMPVLIHGAFMSGATVGDVVAASGMDFSTMSQIWLNWATGLRQIWDDGDQENGLAPDEADKVLEAMGFGTGETDTINPDDI